MATIESSVSVASDGMRVSDITDRVGYLMNDEDHTRWTETELLLWINDACRAVLELKPGARSAPADITLNAGVMQTLDDDETFLMLLDVTRNKKGDGSILTPITVADRKLLDNIEPGWYALDQTEEIVHYCYDERSPRVFYVYPPAIEGAVVEASISATPPEITDPDGVVDMPFQYIEAIVNYVCYRAATKDAEEGDIGNAPSFFGAFQTSLGISAKKELTNSPNGARK